MSLYALIKRNGPSGFGYDSTAEDVTAGLDLGGKTILVTGCSSGLGFETMRVLALRGATVIGTARTEAKAQAAAAAVGGRVSAIACDLSEPSSVRGAVAAVKAGGAPLDAVICNAGVMGLPRLTLIHGLEGHFFRCGNAVLRRGPSRRRPAVGMLFCRLQPGEPAARRGRSIDRPAAMGDVGGDRRGLGLTQAPRGVSSCTARRPMSYFAVTL